MFHVPEEMLTYWKEEGKPKATADDIARIQEAIGALLPRPYIEFVTRFGFVVFNDVPGMRDTFSYTVDHPGTPGTYQGDIAFLPTPDRLIKAYDILTTARHPEDETLPAFPRNFLPIGNDAGQGQILLEVTGQPGRVWYWTEKEWAWGLEDNQWLGFVADDFYRFIGKLQPSTSPEAGGLPFYP